VLDIGDRQRVIEHVVPVVVVFIPVSVPAVNCGHGYIPLHMSGEPREAPDIRPSTAMFVVALR
jgi:hypothetical protein